MTGDNGFPVGFSDEEIARAKADLEQARLIEIAISATLKEMRPPPEAAACIAACSILLGRMLAVADAKAGVGAAMRRARMNGVLNTVTASYDAQADLIAKAGGLATTNGKGRA